MPVEPSEGPTTPSYGFPTIQNSCVNFLLLGLASDVGLNIPTFCKADSHVQDPDLKENRKATT